MQITCNEISNKKYIQIYLTANELEKNETKKVIKKYKMNNYNVAVFLTGKENYPEILQKIIDKQIEISNNVF